MKHLTGTRRLTAVAFRRDRIQLLVWVFTIAAFAAFVAAAVKAVIETDQDLIDFTELYVVNPTMRLFGLASGVSDGGFVMTRSGFLLLVLAALMSSLAVTRHTRQDEDDRRTELFRSTVVGRHAALASGLIVASTASVLVAIFVALALMLNGLPTAGSVAAGASVGAAGLVFAGVGAVAAQLAGNARSANGFAALVLGATYLVAGIGNMLGRADEEALRIESAWPAWFSPIGWSQQVRPFHDNNWWVLALPVALFAVLALLAFRLESHRDLGRGMLPESRGPAEAARSLLSPVGLAWRLQRGLLIGWAIGIGVFGVVIGAVSSEIESLLDDAEGLGDWVIRLGGSEQVVDGYFSMIVGIIGSVIAIYALQVLLRMRSDEDQGLAEIVLATSVGRTRWTLSFIGVALTGTLVLLLVAGLTTGIVSGIVMEDFTGQRGSLLTAAAVQAPATLVVAGAVVAAFGLLPRRATALAWLVFVVALVLGPVVGEILDLPGWLRNLSPFTHTPLAMIEDVSAVSIVVMTTIATVLALVGVASFRRRDLALQSG